MAARPDRGLRRASEALRLLKEEAERAVARLHARQRALAEERQQLIDVFNSHEGLRLTFASTLTRALADLALRAAALNDETRQAELKLSDIALRAKRAETLGDDRDDAWRKERQRRELDHIIDRAVMNRVQASSKPRGPH